LTRAWEQDNQNWAKKLIELLEKINRAVNGAGGKLESSEAKTYRLRACKIITWPFCSIVLIWRNGN
jgi:hypothetical protein